MFVFIENAICWFRWKHRPWTFLPGVSGSSSAWHVSGTGLNWGDFKCHNWSDSNIWNECVTIWWVPWNPARSRRLRRENDPTCWWWPLQWWLHNTNFLLSIEWNSIRLSGPAHGIVTKTVQKTLPGGGGGQRGGGVGVGGVRGVWVVGRGWWG